MAPIKALFILTSHDKMGDTDDKTGFYYEEMTAPYYLLQDEGIDVELASIKGGKPPADPGSLNEDPKENPDSVNRFRSDDDAMQKLRNTRPVSEYKAEDFDVIYFPGGHGTMWDFPNNDSLSKLLSEAYNQNKVIAAVCHGPAAFIGPEVDGHPIVENKRLNCFTDDEEKHVEKEDVVPFLLQSKLSELGAFMETAGIFEGKVVEDGPFVTGQNPASAALVAQGIIRKLQDRNILKAA